MKTWKIVFLHALFSIVLGFALGAMLIYLGGCASVTKVAASPTAHPLTTIAHIEAKLDKGLIAFNLVGIVGLALGFGAVVYGLLEDKPLEKIGFIVLGVSGGLVAVTLTGLFVLPFAPWIIGIGGILALAFASYLVYTKFFTKSATPIVPLVK